MYPAGVFRLAVALAFLSLGTWVLLLSVRHRLHRAFSLLMFNLATVYTATAVLPDITWAPVVWRIAQIALPFAIVNFALVFHRVHRHDAQPHMPAWWLVARWGTVASLVVAIATYMIRPEWFADNTWTWVVAVHAWPVAAAAASALMAWDYAKTEPGQHRVALGLFALAFLPHPAMQGAFRLLETFLAPSDFEGWTFGLSIAALALSVCAAAILVWARLPGDHASQAVATGALMLTPLAVASAGAVELAGLQISPISSQVMLVVVGAVWNLLFAGLVAYSILRFNLFSLDPRFKAVVREGVFVAIFGVLLFVVEQMLQQAISSSTAGSFNLGIVVALVVCGVVTVGLIPVRRGCLRLAERVAHSRHTDDGRRRGLEIYRAAFEAANQDGVITRRERDALHRLASSLGLGAKQTREIEAGLPAAAQGTAAAA